MFAVCACVSLVGRCVMGHHFIRLSIPTATCGRFGEGAPDSQTGWDGVCKRARASRHGGGMSIGRSNRAAVVGVRSFRQFLIQERVAYIHSGRAPHQDARLSHRTISPHDDRGSQAVVRRVGE